MLNNYNLGKMMLFLPSENQPNTLDLNPPLIPPEKSKFVSSIFHTSVNPPDQLAQNNDQLDLDFSMEDYRKLQELGGMQDPGSCCSVKLVLEIAKILVGNDGSFRGSYIPFILCSLKLQFGSENVPPFVTTIRKYLKLLQSSKTNKGLLFTFNHLVLPQNPTSRSLQLIRVTLGKGEKELITDKDARVVFLQYLLSEPRQGDTGTCFADCWHIALSKIRPDILANDMVQILMYGAFFRTYLETAYSIDFTPYMTSSSLNQSIIIDQAGLVQIPDTDSSDFIPFNKASGIQAALVQMGIPLEDTQVTGKVLSLLNDQGGLISTTAQLIIETYAKVWLCEDFHEISLLELINKGIYGYVAIESSAPQAAMITAVGSASQYTDECYPKNLLIRCLQSVFSQNIEKQTPGMFQQLFSYFWLPQKSDQSQENKTVNEIFREQLSQLIQLQYEEAFNPKIGSKGLFILHQRNLKKLYSDADLGEKIWNERQFQKFTEEAITNSENAYKANPTEGSTVEVCLAIFNKMKAFTKTPSFMAEVKKNYDPEHPQNLPWRTDCGGSPTSTAKVYLNTTSDPDLFKEIRYAKDGNELLNWYFQDIFNISSNQSQDNLPRFYNGSCQAPGVGHAFNWMLDHVSVLKVVKTAQEKGLELALYEQVEEPGISVADSPIGDIIGDINNWLIKFKEIILDANEEFVEALSSFPSNNEEKEIEAGSSNLSNYQKRLFKTAAEKLLKEGKLDSCLIEFLNKISHKLHQLTVYTFSQKLLKCLEQHFNPDHHQDFSDLITGFVTIAVLNNLPLIAYQNISENALHTADSNWKKNNDWSEDLHFCVFYNPVIKEFCLGFLTGNNQNLKPLPIIKNFKAELYNIRELSIPNVIS